MAIIKNPWIRYKTLDKCFSNTGRNFTFKDLLSIVNERLAEINPKDEGIKDRQLRDDLAFMRSEEGWNAEIITTLSGIGREYYYRYEDPNFSILKQPMNAMEAGQMREALELLQRFSGMPQFDWIQEFIPQLEKSFEINKKVDTIIGFDDNPDLKGRQFIEELYQHIIDKNVLTIAYQAFQKETQDLFIIHPYFLKQFNKRWYLFGRNVEADKIFNIALDRIVSIEPNNRKYIPNKETDFTDYFDDIIGVTKNEKEKILDIVLLFNPVFANYIKTKPISPFQKQKDLSDGSLEVRLKLIPNKELYALLLSYGSEVKIIKPQQLIDRIKEEYKKAISQY